MCKALDTILCILLALFCAQLAGLAEEQPVQVVFLKNSEMLGYELCPAKPWILKMIGQPKKAKGQVITKIYHGGAAERAGLREGDLITHLDDQMVPQEDFLMIIRNKPIGTTFMLTVQRGVESLQLPLTTVFPPQITDPTYERDSQEVAELKQLAGQLRYEVSLQKDLNSVYKLKSQIRNLLKQRLREMNEEGHPLEAEKTRRILRAF
jgi:hypothetical protein